MQVGGEYRLVYKVSKREVTLLMIGHRSEIYDRLETVKLSESGVVVGPSRGEILNSKQASEDYDFAPTTSPAPDNPLPYPLTRDILDSWGVPREYHNKFYGIKTEGELIELEEVPQEIMLRVMNGLWPKSLAEIEQKPVRVANSPAEIDDAAQGKRSLASFLLRLDEEQEEFVSRVKGTAKPKGPWLLKGGPGSGKSTIALYCLRALLHSLHQTDLFDEDRPLRILYTTYTNSLVKASKHLLKMLNVENSRHSFDVSTVDSQANRHLPHDWRGLHPQTKTEDYVLAAIHELGKCDSRFNFKGNDAKFIADELEWIIVGAGLNSVEEYLNYDRTGRGRALGRQQRRQLWQVYEIVKKKLREEGACLFSERLKVAAEHVTPEYDYIFIDEAQDLKPVAIQFLMGLCHNRSNIFLTADINQSIWGNGFSWTKMAEDLNVRGRARVLKRNYRTTKEIWSGVKQLAPETEGTDSETLAVEAVYRGPRPILARYNTIKEQVDRLNSFIYEALRKERATLNSAAILCPTQLEMNRVVELLDKRFNAKAMRSNELDISHPGVKVLTMHAAKGLEFPVVAVVGLEAGRFPWSVSSEIDKEEHEARQQRLLFVACSRAMRRLIVFAHKDRPSPFVEGLTDEFWEIEEL